jgi:Ca-activated chloride channel family protein
MSDFHFLRPEWFLALLPAALVVWIVWRAARTGSGRDWAGLIDAHLLRHLTVPGAAARAPRALIASLALGLLAAVVALAGPAWEKLPVPTARGGEPTVVVLSLAQSMNGADLVPSRLARAGHKLRDILDRASGEDTGLVIYADRPFVAAPLTPDAGVIREMLPELSTGLMPVLGNRLDRAIGAAQDLLSSAGATGGRVLVMADDAGDDPDAAREAAAAARRAGYEVDVLGVGTEEGAALQTADGRAIRVGGAEAPVATLDRAALSELAQAGGGRYAEITATSDDLDGLLPSVEVSATGGKPSDLKADRWLDRGYLLLLIPVLLMPLAFRRGVLFAIALCLMGLGAAPRAEASGWDAFWATPDQQGARDYEAGNYAAAAASFEAPDWKAASLYRNGDFDAAAKAYGSGFNAGNALARAGKLEEALAAYDAHLATQPDDADAKFNRDLVAKLLEEQKQQQDQQQNGGSQDQQKDQQAAQDQQSDQDQDQQGGKDQQKQQGSQGQDQKDRQAGQDQQQNEQNGDADRTQGEPSNGSQGEDQASTGDQTEDQQGKSSDRRQAGASEQQTGADEQADGVQKSSAGNQPKDGRGDRQDQAQQDRQSGDQPSAPQNAQAGTETRESDDATEQTALGAGPSDADDEGALSGLIDRLLQGNGEPSDDRNEQGQQVAATGAPLDQSAEQQLRAVPDDPSGLLRARIRQHYAQLRANGN